MQDVGPCLALLLGRCGMGLPVTRGGWLVDEGDVVNSVEGQGSGLLVDHPIHWAYIVDNVGNVTHLPNSSGKYGA